MRFVVDESTGTAVGLYLRDAGYDVLIVAETMPAADDAAILARAVTEQRIVVTNDKDFGELVFRSGQPHQGVVLFRLQDESSGNRVHVMAALLSQYAARLPGNFIVATEQKVRIRSITSPNR